MKLTKVRIREFQSIQDSNEFNIGDVTCLVGKNEAGKTALLRALYRLNPVRPEEGDFNTTYDFPRRDLVDYENQVESGERDHAEVVEATYELESEDIADVQKLFGTNCFKDEFPVVTLHKGYSNETEYSGLNFDNDEAIAYLINSAGISNPTEKLLEQNTAQEMAETLASFEEQSEAATKLKQVLERISGQDVSDYVFRIILDERIPKFLYFDEYYQMKGQDNLQELRSREENQTTKDADQPLLGLIANAGLNLDQLINPKRMESLIARLEASASQLTKTMLKYWSQNRHLRMKFDIREREQEDPPEIKTGKNILGRVEDTKNGVSTPLASRSKGFIWFFSFLAWYSHLRRKNENLILLLDEPGLSLHAKAQADLLHYFEEELKPHHQLLYTTHSPFMVDPTHFDRVRIVQDLSLEEDSEDLLQEFQGTRVSTDVLSATADSLFPLQSALGYEITQTLFIGPNCLVVEGVSDLLYIQTMSALLQKRGMAGLSSHWTVTPVGGSAKVSTFVALLGAQNLNVAVLIDFQDNDQASIEHLYKEKLRKKKQVLTYADYVSRDEADIEDMFDPDFYLRLVDREFGSSFSSAIILDEGSRIVRRLESHLRDNPLPDSVKYNHYRPARFFSENVGSLESEICEQTFAHFQKAFEALNELL